MKQRILIIDDEPQLAQALAIRLRAAGFAPETACDGADGLTKAKTQVPDLIVLDLLMPDVDGYEVCRRLKADTHTRQVPILVLTAERRCAMSDAARILYKPFDSQEFLSTVRELLAITSQGATHAHESR